MGCANGKQPPALPSRSVELSREPMAAMAGPSPTHVLLGRTKVQPQELGFDVDGKAKIAAASEAKAKSQPDEEDRATVSSTPATTQMKRGNPLHIFGSTPTRSEACMLGNIDDKPGTIESLAGAKEAIEAIAGGSDQARKPLTSLLADLGYTVDRMFSHVGILGDGAFNDTQGFIAHNEDDVVLAYRGTVGFMDALTDLLAGHVPFQPAEDKGRGSAALCSCFAAKRADDLGRAHRGFYDAFLSSMSDIEEVLIPLLEGPKPGVLILAGHSLGGAIATGALAYLLKRLDFVASQHRLLFVTIGQPRFGDQRFRAWVRAEVQKLRKLDRCVAARFVHDHDGVPLVPPEHLAYTHVSEMCLLTEDGDLIVDPELLESSSAERVGEYLEDHNPLLYLNLLSQAAGKLQGCEAAVHVVSVGMLCGNVLLVAPRRAAAAAAKAAAVAVAAAVVAT
eukprot:CAMPEP_0115469858 /NCGR_PEP_ID=MMETSP0271-20121206/51700_1 /TAXON_ID=71861 /ORGANISM="Scrippsiella trochoidea, Strain CCMP3099" /LENGTH=449 /DNA_ID=CAMNT_0002896977 /DNA_START=68 /DNA_END=1416 /DNA_ORIENTATION=-